MPRNKTYADASKAIGDTPMIQINRLVPADWCDGLCEV